MIQTSIVESTNLPSLASVVMSNPPCLAREVEEEKGGEEMEGRQKEEVEGEF